MATLLNLASVLTPTLKVPEKECKQFLHQPMMKTRCTTPKKTQNFHQQQHCNESQRESTMITGIKMANKKEITQP
jgi:hypothetical protein